MIIKVVDSNCFVNTVTISAQLVIKRLQFGYQAQGSKDFEKKVFCLSMTLSVNHLPYISLLFLWSITIGLISHPATLLYSHYFSKGESAP